MESNVVIYTEIQTKQRPRARMFGKYATIYTPKETKDYEHLIATEYTKLGGKDFGNNPIKVEIDFGFKHPSNGPKGKIGAIDNNKNMENYIPNTIHKDLDNLAKSILDALNGLAYEDDRQVVGLDSRKHGTTGNEKIRIRIVQIEYTNDKQIKENYKQGKKQMK